MGVWRGVAMDSIKFHPGLPCSTVLHPAGRPPHRTTPQGTQPAAVFYHFGHPTRYAFGKVETETQEERITQQEWNNGKDGEIRTGGKRGK
jgi:hypothetical protein